MALRESPKDPRCYPLGRCRNYKKIEPGSLGKGYLAMRTLLCRGGTSHPKVP